MPLQAPIMLALCSTLSRTYYAGNYARIIAASLASRHCVRKCTGVRAGAHTVPGHPGYATVEFTTEDDS